MSDGPLEGIRIADFTQIYQGPLASQILGDLGADIVKVEPPQGDFMRRWSLGDYYPAGESMSFLSVNRNKRSLVVNLKRSEGTEVARRLIARSDVLLENFRPGVMDRLGLGFGGLAESNPRLIYCASSGYGQAGPYRGWPGQDLLAQALAGTLWLNGRQEDPPTAVGFPIADSAAGLQIVQGVMAALFERERSGLGQRVDVSLLGSLLVLQNQELTYYVNTHDPPIRPRAHTTGMYAGAPLGVYETRDGYLAIAMMPIGRLATLLGVDELRESQVMNDLEHRDQIHETLEAAFKTRTRDEWMAILRAEDVWAAPVHGFEDVEWDSQVVQNGSFATIDHPTVGQLKVATSGLGFSRTPARPRRPPPLFGEHTLEVLAELRYTERQIATLIETEVAIGAVGIHFGERREPTEDAP